MRIGICAPSTPLRREDAARVRALAADRYPDAELIFDDQCFFSRGHFAGTDEERAEAFVRLANDPALDAIWIARGGYGAARIAAGALPLLNDAARAKTYMGYSDAGNLLAALYRADIGRPVHGPMPIDIVRDRGEMAVNRALDWLVTRDASALEPGLEGGRKYAAFNLVTLALVAGTPLMPDLAGHVLMIEEVSEHLYAVDRALFSVTSHLAGTGLTGLRLGRISSVPVNDRPFGEDAESIARRWCERTDIAFLGTADIGHDIANKVVPFGTL